MPPVYLPGRLLEIASGIGAPVKLPPSPAQSPSSLANCIYWWNSQMAALSSGADKLEMPCLAGNLPFRKVRERGSNFHSTRASSVQAPHLGYLKIGPDMTRRDDSELPRVGSDREIGARLEAVRYFLIFGIECRDDRIFSLRPLLAIVCAPAGVLPHGVFHTTAMFPSSVSTAFAIFCQLLRAGFRRK